MESSHDSNPDHASNTEKISKSCKELISTLPKIEGWSSNNITTLYLYQGFWYYEMFLHGLMSAQDNFQPQPSDIILCSAMKTGTTWLKSLAFAIAARHSFDQDSTHPLLLNISHAFVPLLEARYPRPRDSKSPLLSSHLPYSSLPVSITRTGCKIVYICRDLKDTFVSTYLFYKKLWAEKGIEIKSIEEAFELFCEGKCYGGPYWDHILEYWKASLEQPDKVLFLKYEELKEDTGFYVKKIAEFMGYAFSSEEEQAGEVEKIVELCSFENLSNLEVNKTGVLSSPSVHQNNAYFRKGKVGDWKNYLTPEMASRLDEITEEKLGMYGLTLNRR